MNSAVDYEESALEWLHTEAAELLRELRRAGLDDASRRRVAGNYLFGLAARLDGAEGPGTAKLGFIVDGKLTLPDQTCSLHEYALGTVEEAADSIG